MNGRFLIKMTRKRGRTVSRDSRAALADGKACFSEVVRTAKTEGPQQPTGQALVKLLQDSPLREIKMDRKRTWSRVRGVEL